MGPALQPYIFVGQGPCALPGVRYGIGGRTEASAPPEMSEHLRRAACPHAAAMVRWLTGGGVRAPRPTGAQGVRCGEESPSHGFAVPAPFRQGGRGDGGCGLPRPVCELVSQ